jgi:hypothetical protein
MVVWQVLIIVLGSFSIAFFAAMVGMNIILLLFVQEKLEIDPVNYAFLSIIFPVCKLPTAKLESEPALKLLFCLLIAGNCFLVSAYSIVYSLYYFDFYNPWCREDLDMLLFPEDWFSRSFPLVSPTTLFKTRIVCPSVLLSICPSFRLSVCPSFRLSVCSSVRLSIFLSVRLFVCPSVRLSACPSVRLSVCPSVSLSVCLRDPMGPKLCQVKNIKI